jgi:hypothetical protein
MERLQINAPVGKYGDGDVRTLIGSMAQAGSLTLEVYDIEGEMLTPPQSKKMGKGWTLMSVPNAVRYEVRSEKETR